METVEFSSLYNFWKMYADELGFDNITYDNLPIFVNPDTYIGNHRAYFYDLKHDQIVMGKSGWETTAWHLLMNSIDHEKMVAVHIMATIFNIFDGINDRYMPEHFCDPKINDYQHAVFFACRKKVGFAPGMIWHHRHSDVYPKTITYDKFTFYHNKVFKYHKTHFDPYLIVYMAVLEAKINMERFGIYFSMNKEALDRSLKHYHEE
jgi:hypothetical protein